MPLVQIAQQREALHAFGRRLECTLPHAHGGHLIVLLVQAQSALDLVNEPEQQPTASSSSIGAHDMTSLQSECIESRDARCARSIWQFVKSRRRRRRRS